MEIDDLPDECKKVLIKFPEFQISEFINSGANGYVMIGRHEVLLKDVAIKIYFHAENEVDQEPAIISTLNHENILKVFDARKLDDCCSYYMMQVANDGDLFTFQRRYHLSLDLSFKLLCHLLSGLSELHRDENKLVHRDLKPENLLVHDEKLVIADFGSVRRFEEATGKAPSSKHSILFRPPEAFGNNAFFDCSSDVYQAGIIGYLLLGGKLSNDLLTHLLKKELRELESAKNIWGDFEISVFIDSCIEKRTKARNLLDWDSIPFYVPSRLKRVVRAAVAGHDNRYKNVSEFLSELAKVRPTLPDWIENGGSYELRNWNGNDYMLLENKGQIVMKKKKHRGVTYRNDRRVNGFDYSTAHKVLKKIVGLP